MALVEVTTEGEVALCRLNRPEARNALSDDLKDELAAAVARLNADDSIHCIVIAGDDQAFAAGADVKALADHRLDEDLGPSASFWRQLAAVRTPMIAAVSGWALGGGCELALLCDMIVASETAEFGQPEITLAIIPGGGGTQRLARVAGKQRAMELVLTGRRFSAQEAHAMGIVNQVTKKREWLEKAMELAEVVARRPPAGGAAGQGGGAGSRGDRPHRRPRARAPAVRDRDGDRGPNRGDAGLPGKSPARLQGAIAIAEERPNWEGESPPG